VSAAGVFDAPRNPAAELRTSLALASLTAALVHGMSAAHGTPVLVALATAALLTGLAALFAFTASRAVLAPAIAFNVVLLAGGQWLAAPAQLAVAGGALALLWGASDRTLSRWSKLAFAAFALAAFTGFGHLAH
jgi:hypothetical protein